MWSAAGAGSALLDHYDAMMGGGHRFGGPPGPSPGEGGRNTIDHDHELLDLTTEATPHDARRLRVRFQEWLRAAGAAAIVIDDLALAVYEALANVVEHAYHPGHPNPVMRLRAQFNHDQVLITISDYGCWRTPQAPGSRGRGLTVMRHLATEVRLHPTPDGTTVHLRALLHHNDDGRAPTEPAPAP